MRVLRRQSPLHDSPTGTLKEWLSAQQPSQMDQGRDSDARTLAFANVLTSLFVEHPLRKSELCTVRQPDLDIIAGHDAKPADDSDFFAEVGMESVIDSRRGRFMGSVTVVSRSRMLPTWQGSTRG